MSMLCKPTSSSISPETRAIIKRKTGKDYEDPRDLPSNLDLSFCEDLVDVSALGGVRYLNLSGCTGVVDVSALGACRYLNLRGCTGVVDVSAVPQAYH